MNIMRGQTKYRRSGFSLIEMAVVLMIVGTLLSGVLVAVSQSTESSRRTNAKVQLRQVEEALYGYAAIYGRLPCPATSVSDGQAVPLTTITTCINKHGFVPVATLGISGSINADGLLVDPWQNPLRYSVAWTINPSFSEKADLQAFFQVGTAFTANNMLRVCTTTNCAAGSIVASMLPAVVLSMGANWATYTSSAEQTNAGNGSTKDGAYNIHTSTGPTTTATNFVSLDYSENNFDDQLVWISPYILLNRMVSAGKLP